MVEKACIIAGLDPYVGFLHTDSYNKMSLVFDIIEMFRTLVQGMGLSKDGKAALIEALNKNFEETILYRGRNVKTRNTIQMECHRIANSLIRPGQELPEDYDQNILGTEEDVGSASGECGTGGS
jgi:CRISP-associated protein Cas1